MMIGHQYLLLVIALVFLVTNCIGAGITIGRLRARGRDRKAATLKGSGHVMIGK